MNYGFVIDNRRCIGCHACTVACKSEHDIPVGVNRTYVKTVEKGVFPDTRRTFTVTRCNHCEDAPCAEICPTSALFTRHDGIVDFDSDRCIACKSCMQACPYDALYIDPATRTAAKCNYCAHRTESGYQPACVIVCPVEAIVAGDLQDPSVPIARLVAREEVTTRKPEKGTLPNVYYIEGDQEALNPAANPVQTEYLTTSQAMGVGHFAGFVEDRLSRAAREDIFEPMGGEGTSGEPGGVHLAGSISISQRAIDDVQREIESGASDQGSRRVYDTPDKGVLWGWQVPAYIWTKAVSTGLFLAAVLAGIFGDQLTTAEQFRVGAVSTLFLLLTAALLIHDLDRPERFLYVLLRPNFRSWLVRGAYIISAFGGILALQLAALWWGRPGLAAGLGYPGLVLALLGSVYTAFLFAQARGRDLWQSPLSAIRMLNHALLCGSVALLLLAPGTRDFSVLLLTATVAMNLLVLALEVFTPHGSVDAHRAMQIITKGQFRASFYAGIVVGNLLPLAVLLLAPALPLLVTAGILAAAAVFLTEFLWVRAPQLIPLA